MEKQLDNEFWDLRFSIRFVGRTTKSSSQQPWHSVVKCFDWNILNILLNMRS